MKGKKGLLNLGHSLLESIVHDGSDSIHPGHVEGVFKDLGGPSSGESRHSALGMDPANDRHEIPGSARGERPLAVGRQRVNGKGQGRRGPTTQTAENELVRTHLATLAPLHLVTNHAVLDTVGYREPNAPIQGTAHGHGQDTVKQRR